MKVRVLISEPGKEPANLWMDMHGSDGAVFFRLLHDYPDFAPQPGWHIVLKDLVFEITAVNGLDLNLRVKEVASHG